MYKPLFYPIWIYIKKRVSQKTTTFPSYIAGLQEREETKTKFEKRKSRFSYSKAYFQGSFAVIASEARLMVSSSIGHQLIDYINSLIANLTLLLRPAESHQLSISILRSTTNTKTGSNAKSSTESEIGTWKDRIQLINLCKSITRKKSLIGKEKTWQKSTK